MSNAEFAYNNLLESLNTCIEKAYEEAQGDKAKFKFCFLELFGRFNGGMVLYIPKYDIFVKKSARNNLIRKDFTGSNHSELSLKYGLSVQQIYKILKGKMPNELD
ncbi:TPA: Mor transcription activator family protein [Mannheimia haemolytica]